MTSTGLHDTGEEWAQKYSWRQDLISRGASVDVLLYLDDSDIDGDGVNEGDQLIDASDVGDITTEPSDGNYVRQSVSLDSADVSLSVVNGDVEAEFTVTFDTTNTTGHIDAHAVVADFQSDIVNAESGSNPHLVTSAAYESDTDLGNGVDTFDATVTISLT